MIEDIRDMFLKSPLDIRFQLDNLDWAILEVDEYEEVVVRNEHGIIFPLEDLSEVELKIVYYILINNI